MLSGLRRLLMRLRAFLAPTHAERELEREMATHVLMLVQRYQRQGLSLAEARRAARHALGGIDQTKERQRNERSFPLLEDLRRDLAYSVRTLAKARGFTVAAVLTLAVGIGATSTLFTVAYGLLLKPLPFALQPERLVRLLTVSPNPEGPAGSPRKDLVILTLAEAADVGARVRSLSAIGLVSPTIMGLAGQDDAGRVPGARLSAATFVMLGMQPLLGRVILPEDETTGRDVVVLGHALWQRFFAGDPTIVGRAVTFDTVLGRRVSRAFLVVGVMPPTFSFPNRQTQFWMPPPVPTAGAPPWRAPLLAKLAPRVTPQAALNELERALRDLRPQESNLRYEMTREQELLVLAVRPALLALSVSAFLLLLIAALNVSNLQLARALARQREFAVRASVGASRGRLLRQCVTESALVGLLAGLAGLALAVWAVTAFQAFAATSSRFDLAGAGELPRIDEVAVNWPVILATIAGAVMVATGAGLAGALRVSSRHALSAVRLGLAGTSTSAGASGAWLARRALIVAQVAGSLALLIGAALLTRTFWNLTHIDPGYTRDSVFTFQVNLPASHYPNERLRTFAESLTARLQAVPGIQVAAYANQLPFVGLRDTAGGLWRTPDATRKAAPEAADARLVSRAYFDAIRMQLRAGRGFEDRDGPEQPRVLVINETLARREFAGEDPIGKLVYVGRDSSPWQIIGIVADVRQFGLDREPEPQFFIDLRQWSTGLPLFPAGAYYVLRTGTSPDLLLPAIRTIARTIDPEAAVFNSATMNTITSLNIARPRLYAIVASGFAAIGVLLAAIGIFGVLAYLVRERTAEIGIRVALGATRADILRLVTGQGLTMVAMGIGLGVLGAVALTRYLESLLFGVRPLDARTFVMASALLLAVATAAVLAPARRAARVDPLAAIRCE